MGLLIRRFDRYLEYIRASDLKYMARTWGGDQLGRKQQFIMCIRNGLANPTRVRQVIAALDPFEHNVLAQLKRFGGTATPSDLEFAVQMSGISTSTHRHRMRGYSNRAWGTLVRKGLLLVDSTTHPASYDIRHGKFFSDDRLLAAVGEPHRQPLFSAKMKTKPDTLYVLPQRSVFRSAPIVMLDLVGFVQTIEDQNGFRLTKNGSIRVHDLRKLNRARGWEKEKIVLDGLTFPQPSIALIQALRDTGWIIAKGNNLRLKEPAHEFAKLPVNDQVQLFLQGITKNPHWIEWNPPRNAYVNSDNYVLGRQALLTLLKDLPLTPEKFFSFDEFDQAFFDRIGEHFSLRYPPHRPSSYRYSSNEMADVIKNWQRELRNKWVQREKVWIRHALSTWLYFFGMVELGLSEDDTIIGLRLTDLGRRLLHPEYDPPGDSSVSVNQSTWVIQPNFEIIVYLNHATTDQLAFLEAHADRVSIEQFTAQYQLNRESVYKGLERGSSVESILETLRIGSNRPIPQNIAVEINEWAGLREKIVLHRQTHLLEYPSTEARDQAIKQKGLTGEPVGERFVLVTETNGLEKVKPASIIDYARALPRTLAVKESGILQASKKTSDLLLQEQLNTWAKPIKHKQWQLSKESVSAAIKKGYTRAMLLHFLEHRRTTSLPEMLELAVHNWTGKKTTVTLQSVTLFHCRPAILEAVTNSRTLGRYIDGFVTDEIVAIEKDKVDAFRKELAWLDVEIEEDLIFS